MMKHIYMLLLVIAVPPVIGSIKKSLARGNKQVTTTQKGNNQYQSSERDIVKAVKVIAPIAISLLVILYIVLRLSLGPRLGKGFKLTFGEQEKGRFTDQEFQKLFIKISEDEVAPLDFARFQSIRKRAGEDILNQPIKGYSNALEYFLLHKKGSSSSPLLMLLIDPNNEAATKIKVTETAFVEVIERVIKSKITNLDLLKSILPKVDPEILNKKLIIYQEPLGENCKKYTALDYFILKKKTDIIDIFLSKESYIKAQIPSTVEGVIRVIRLAILASVYQNHLGAFLKEASENLLKRVACSSDFSGCNASDTSNLSRLMEQTIYALYIFNEDQEVNINACKNILNSLLNSKKKITISASTMMNIFYAINENTHDQGLDWFTKMRKKATTTVLTNVLNKLLKNSSLNNIVLRSTVLDLLSNHQGSEHPTQINEDVVITTICADCVEEIFSKFDFVPDLLSKTIENKNIVDFLTDQLLQKKPDKKYVDATLKIVAQKSYQDELLRPTSRGLKLAVALARYSTDYLEQLQKIISKIDINLLAQPLFGQDYSQNAFEYALEIENKRILEAILDKKSYRERLFTQDVAGFERAVKAAILTPLYHHELKVIYETNRELLTKKIFNAQQKNVLDYTIDQNGKHESNSLIKLLLKQPTE